MYEGGFKFTDFYTPLWGVSTSDGEYVACTGLLPKAGIWSFYRSSENYMPFCMGNQMKAIGYQTLHIMIIIMIITKGIYLIQIWDIHIKV